MSRDARAGGLPRPVPVSTPRGTLQSDRAPAALRPGWFDVDERRFEDWVALLAAQSRHLRLPALDGRGEQRWSVLFEHHELLLLARIAAAQDEPPAAPAPGSAEAAAHAALAGLDVRAAALVRELLRLSQAFEGWTALLQRCEGEGAALMLQLLKLVQDPQRGRLHAELAWVRSRWLDAAQPRAAEASELLRLRSVHALFAETRRRLREAARVQIARVEGAGTHDPAVSLLATVLRLYGTVQSHLNGFTQRLIDFHVEQVLGMRPRPAEPDRVLLLAQRQRGAPADPVLAAGTRVLAGRDDGGRDIVFLTRQALRVGDAQVAALHTLRLDCDPLISPEHELGFVCRARSQALPVAGVADASLPVWPLFGGDEVPPPQPAQEASFGLALASRLLLLLEGRREIRLKLRLGPPAATEGRLRPFVERVRQQLALVPGRAAAADALPVLEPDPPRDPVRGLEQALAALFLEFAALERGRARLGGPQRFARWTALAAQRLVASPRSAPGVLELQWLFLLLRAQHVAGADWRFAAGRLFTHWLLYGAGEGAQEIGEADLAALREAARKPLSAVGAPRELDPLSLFLGARPPRREVLRMRLFQGLFSARRTAPDGWREVDETHLVGAEALAEGGPGLALELLLRLDGEEPPLVGCDPKVHGAGWDTPLPLLQLRLRAGGLVYAYSLLESAQLLGVDIGVSVQGLRQVALHNQLGPLDPGKPFQPFGPLPAQGSFLMIGAREIAAKPLSALSLHLRWGGLPMGPAGFAGHYAAWPGKRDNFSFRAVPAVLQDGRWMRLPGQELPLFAAPGATLALLPRQTLALDPELLRRHYRPLPGPLPQKAPAFDIGTTRALLRLQLAQPDGAFGHAEYATLLSETMAARSRRAAVLRGKVEPPPLPAPPYTPVLEGMALDYRAEGRLRLWGDGGDDDEDESQRQRLYHLHPFGLEPVYPRPHAGPCRVLPTLAHDGNLYLGLRAAEPPRRLSLLFRLQEVQAAEVALPPPRQQQALYEAPDPDAEAAARRPEDPVVPEDGAPAAPRWCALVGDRWEPLAPRQVLRDGTAGFQTTGIVVLELPAAMDLRHRVMPDGLFWLSVSVDEGFGRYAGLLGVQPHAVEAVRELPGDGVPMAPLPAQAAFAVAEPVPGLAGLRAVAPPTGLRPPETGEQLRVRAGERLRHRHRAVLPWDYERLVLDHFPDVGQVKCFSVEQVRQVKPQLRGVVVVAVVPGAHRYDPAGGITAPRFNAVELRRMQQRLQDLAPPFARVQVRNAEHERIQVRCALRLADDEAEGPLLQRCERAVWDFLSPWVPGGLDSRFGWVLRAEDVEARLREVPGVSAVSALSLLQISRDARRRYRLGDSARMASADPNATPQVVLRPVLPWGLPLPMEQHLITAHRGQSEGPATAVGISDLAVGSNFIIGAHD